MNSEITIKVNACDYVPDGQAERVAWLERHGVPPESSEVQVSGSLAEYVAAGVQIELTGRAAPSTYYATRDPIFDLAKEAICKVARETGSVPELLPEPYRTAVFRAAAERYARSLAAKAASEAQQQAKDEQQQQHRRELLATLRAVDVEAAARRALESGHTTFEDDIRHVAGVQSHDVSVPSDVIEAVRTRYAQLEIERDRQFNAFVLPALSAEQRERYTAGVLLQKERDAAVRERLFAEIDLPRYQKIMLGDLHHGDECLTDYEPSIKTIELKEPPELTEIEFARYKAIKAAAARLYEQWLDAEVSLVWRKHYSDCPCSGPGHVQLGCRITITTCGHSYSREYAIT